MIEKAAKIKTFSNGIKIITKPRYRIPMVVLSALIKIGSADEPENLAGLANLTSELIRQGSTQWSASELENRLDTLGASLSVRTSRDWSRLDLSLPSSDLLAGAEIFLEILNSPTFPESEIERKKVEICAEIMRIQDLPQALGNQTFQELLFSKHVYHRPILGYLESLMAINRSDITGFFEKYFTPTNFSSLALVGDFHREKAVAELSRIFNKWQSKPGAGKRKKPNLQPNFKGFSQDSFQVIDKAIEQCFLTIGQIGLSRKSEDFFAFRMLSEIFGGGFSSWLFQSLRTQRGFSYSAYSNLSAWCRTGAFYSILQTKPEQVKKALKLTLKLLKRMKRQGPTYSELESAKKHLIGKFKLSLQSNLALADFFLKSDFYGLGLQNRQKVIQSFQEVTVADIKRVARQYLNPEKQIVVIVGRPTDLS